MLTEKRNEVFDYKQIEFTISKTPGALNLGKFTFSEYNTTPHQSKFIRKCWQGAQETYASETLELMEKVRKQRAKEQSQRREGVAVFHEIVTKQKVRDEKMRQEEGETEQEKQEEKEGDTTPGEAMQEFGVYQEPLVLLLN